MNAGLHKCETPDCLRLVGAASAHCCRACALAAEGGYEIHEDGPLGHSRWCDERAAERGPWLTRAQAIGKLADEAVRRRRVHVNARDFAAIGDTAIDGDRPVWRG